MNPLIQLKTTPPLLVTLALLCFGLLPRAQAVVPPPDGGYPGGNTAEGQAALFSLTTGGFNTAVGFLSLRSNTTGAFNTAIGAGALLANTADQNTATGAGALLSNTTGSQNAANGAFALFGNSEGNFNTANGVQALFSNTTGNQNTAIGNGALFTNTTGDFNTATGLGALLSNTADENTATGHRALFNNTTGGLNTAVGTGALFNNSTGTGNIALGAGAGANSTTGSFNIALGSSAGNAVTTASGVICIGASGANVDDSCFIGRIWQHPGGSQAVYVNSDGKLGEQVSSRRFKDEIKPLEEASEVIYGLRPVSFRYKPEIEPTRPPGFGLIAEDVEKINSDLVVRDKEGQPYSVRYDAVNAMLLNEFLKEHKTVQDQGATIAEVKKEIAALTAGLQKVSAQVEASKPAPQVVNNP